MGAYFSQSLAKLVHTVACLYAMHMRLWLRDWLLRYKLLQTVEDRSFSSTLQTGHFRCGKNPVTKRHTAGWIWTILTDTHMQFLYTGSTTALRWWDEFETHNNVGTDDEYKKRTKAKKHVLRQINNFNGKGEAITMWIMFLQLSEWSGGPHRGSERTRSNFNGIRKWATTQRTGS